MSKLDRARSGQPRAAHFWQLLGMSGFAIAQPVFDLLSRYPEFLVVHDATRTDLVLMAGLLVLAPAILLYLVEVLAGLLGRRVQMSLHTLSMGSLFLLTITPILDRVSILSGWGVVAAGVLLTTAVGLLVWRTRLIRDNLAILAVTTPIILVLFFLSPAFKSTGAPAVEMQDMPVTHASASVVMVIFDELPLSSLLDAQGRIDAELYPGFASLAARSTWYPRATSISGATLRSVPAILTGLLPTWRESPNFADHPRNLFSLLGVDHQVFADETQTSLCPEAIDDWYSPSFALRFGQLWQDLTVLYQHVVVPTAWRGGLPPIGNRWSGFAETPAQTGRPITKPQHFKAWMGRIPGDGGPVLAVTHTLLPHNPYRHLPDGTIYYWREAEPLEPNGHWGDDPLVCEHSFRRHLVQLAAVDRLLTELMDHLERIGLWDECLLLVTADHGAAFRPGESMRVLSATNVVEIMSVPLLIKAPGQTEGRIDQRHMQTVDIMPTLVDLLDIDVDWEFDGRSYADEATADRDTLDFMDQDFRVHRRYPVGVLDRNRDLVARKTAIVGDATEPLQLLLASPWSDLRGREVDSFLLGRDAEAAVTINEIERLKAVNMNGIFRPYELSGTLTMDRAEGRVSLAVAVNGRLAGFTETYWPASPGEPMVWHAFVDPDLVRPGANSAAVYLIDASVEPVRLLELRL